MSSNRLGRAVLVMVAFVSCGVGVPRAAEPVEASTVGSLWVRVVDAKSGLGWVHASVVLLPIKRGQATDSMGVAVFDSLTPRELRMRCQGSSRARREEIEAETDDETVASTVASARAGTLESARGASRRMKGCTKVPGPWPRSSDG
jgi:hypothetical protein